MNYILTAGWDDGVADLTERLVRELASDKRVLWLVSGGSNINASVQIMNNISSKLSQGLGVMLADERYGPLGHSESNWAQLMTANFKPYKATLMPILKAGLNLDETVERYNQLVEQAFEEYDVIIAQLGIGPDGHIAGIMLSSPAIEDSDSLVVGFPAPPLVRMSLTFNGLRKVTAAYVFAFGNTKRQTISNLHDKSLPLSKQPSQILKQLPEAYVYSDQLGATA